MSTTHKPLLLVVEDKPEWQEQLQRAFGSEYLIKFAFSGVEAENSLDIFVALGSPPAICVLDPTLPDSPFSKDPAFKVGEGFAVKLKSYSIPFVVFTAEPSADRVMGAIQQYGASEAFLKHQWPQNKELFLSRVREISARSMAVEPPKEGKSKESTVETTLKGSLWPFFLALVGFPLVVFTVLTIIVLLVPQNLVLAVIGAGIALVVFQVASLALFINKITGEQFLDVARKLLKRG